MFNESIQYDFSLRSLIRHTSLHNIVLFSRKWHRIEKEITDIVCQTICDKDAIAEGKAISQASRFHIRRWNSYWLDDYILAEAEAALMSIASASLLCRLTKDCKTEHKFATEERGSTKLHLAEPFSWSSLFCFCLPTIPFTAYHFVSKNIPAPRKLSLPTSSRREGNGTTRCALVLFEIDAYMTGEMTIRDFSQYLFYYYMLWTYSSIPTYFPWGRELTRKSMIGVERVSKTRCVRLAST